MQAALEPSRLLILIAAHVLASLAISSITFLFALRWLALVMIAASLWFRLCVALLQSTRAPRIIGVTEEGYLNLQDGLGNWSRRIVLNSTYVSGLLVV